MHINLNWFFGVLAIELWIAPYVMMFWPDIVEAWSQSRDERRIRGYVRAYERRQRHFAMATRANSPASPPRSGRLAPAMLPNPLKL